MRTALLTILLSIGLQAADYKDVDKTSALSANGSVTITTHKGSIHVSTWDRPEIEMKARIEAESGEAMDRRLFDATEVTFDSSPNSVHIRTRYPDFHQFESGSN